MPLPPIAGFGYAASWFRHNRVAIALQSLVLLLFQFPDFSDVYANKKSSVYNALWVLVFGFATLNILGLALRRFDSRRGGLSFGEILAILVVVFSIFMLGLEMLNIFHILPVKLEPH